MKKGFIISLDSLLALFVLLSITIASFFYLSQLGLSSFNSNYLKEFSMDSLTILEKSGKLEDAVKNNKSNELRLFLNRLPFQICSELLLFGGRDLNSAAIVVARPGCQGSYVELAVVRRSFLVESGSDLNYYIAQMNSWYRG